MAIIAPSQQEEAGLVDVVAATALLAAVPTLIWASRALQSAEPATGTAELERLVGLACGVAGIVLAAWWATGLVGVAVMALSRRRGHGPSHALAARLTPVLLRRVAAALLGAHILLAPGAAAADVSAAWQPPAPAVPSGPSAAWTPTSPTVAPPGAPARPRTTQSAPTHTVVVGDCLWDIAADELGPDATVIEIDLRWRRWHQANRDVIGEDPHLLIPGTVLTAPPYDPYLSLTELRLP